LKTRTRTPRLSIVQAADQFGISTRTVRRRIAEGKLRAYRVGGLIRIDAEDLAQLAQPIPTAGGGPHAAA
jgi:excisionase family DNA binding protein